MDVISEYKSTELVYNHVIHKNPSNGSFSEEAHNFYELIYIVSGDVSYTIEDRIYKLKKGDLIITEPAKYHFVRIDSEKDYERYDVFFDIRTLPIKDLPPLPKGRDVLGLYGNTVISDIFSKLDFYYGKLRSEDFAKIIQISVAELFFVLSISDNGAHDVSYLRVSPLVSDALKMIGDNLFTLGSVSDLAKELFVTESYLYRCFKKEMHSTPKKYISSKRLLAAQSMISMGEMATKVSEKCGFGDYTSFYRSYVEFFGYPPSKEKVFK